MDSTTPRKNGLLNENPSIRPKIPPYKLFVRGVPEVSKTTRLFPFLLITHHDYMVRPYCYGLKTSLTLGARQKNPSQTDQEIFLLLTSFHRTGRLDPACYNTNLQGVPWCCSDMADTMSIISDGFFLFRVSRNMSPLCSQL